MKATHKTPAALAEKLISSGSLSKARVPGEVGADSDSRLDLDDPTTVPSSIYHMTTLHGIHRNKLGPLSGHHNHGMGMMGSERNSEEVNEGPDLDNNRPFSEFKAIMEECRLRVLKAMKISCWKQYERGSLSEEAVKLLVAEIEEKEDSLLTMIHTEDLRDYWGDKGMFTSMQKGIKEFMSGNDSAPMPTARYNNFKR
jgi:hypothetical protein